MCILLSWYSVIKTNVWCSFCSHNLVNPQLDVMTQVWNFFSRIQTWIQPQRSNDFFPSASYRVNSFAIVFWNTLTLHGVYPNRGIKSMYSVSYVIEEIDVFHFKIMIAHTLKQRRGVSVLASFRCTRVYACIYTQSAGTPLIIWKTSCQLSLWCYNKCFGIFSISTTIAHSLAVPLPLHVVIDSKFHLRYQCRLKTVFAFICFVVFYLIQCIRFTEIGLHVNVSFMVLFVSIESGENSQPMQTIKRRARMNWSSFEGWQALRINLMRK